MSLDVVKNALGDTGHEAPNGTLLWIVTRVESASVRSRSRLSTRPHAAEMAKIKFCESESVKDWTLMPIVFALRMRNSRHGSLLRSGIMGGCWSG